MNQVNGIPVDPELPEMFDQTPNDERPDSHQVWWYRPYIETETWEPESFEQYRERLAGYGYEPDHTADEWRERQEKSRAGWFEAFPEGTRYMVRCLDGGAWDRSTCYGVFDNLDDAVSQALELADRGPHSVFGLPDYPRS